MIKIKTKIHAKKYLLNGQIVVEILKIENAKPVSELPNEYLLMNPCYARNRDCGCVTVSNGHINGGESKHNLVLSVGTILLDSKYRECVEVMKTASARLHKINQLIIEKPKVDTDRDYDYGRNFVIEV